jgi:general stress protein YciG
VTDTERAEARRAGAAKGAAETMQRHGHEHYVRIGKLGGAATREKCGTAHYQKAGQLGGRACLDAHGLDHYVELGKRGGQRVKAIMAAGRQALGIDGE